MEGNENKTNNIDEFVSDFDRFYDKMLEKVKELDDEHIVTLYAIYLKNGRAEAMSGNGNGYFNKKPKSDPNALATDKQKKAIETFVRQGRTASVNLSALKKKEASDIIGKVLGGGNPPFPFLPALYATEEIPVEEKLIVQKWEMAVHRFYWLIAEYDPKKKLAFGYANLNDDQCAEWGYISIKELEENGAVQVKDWKPTKFKNVKKLINDPYIIKVPTYEEWMDMTAETRSRDEEM